MSSHISTLLVVRIALIVAAVAVSSCRDGDDGMAPVPVPVPVAVPAGTFALSVSAPPGGVMRGGEGESIISITRSGGPIGAVALSVTGAPVGVSASIEPRQATESTATLIVRTDASAVPGALTLAITGMAAGRVDQTVRTTFNVVPASSGTGNVLVDFSRCLPSEMPSWFAFQEGDGAWSQVLPVESRFRFDVQAARGAYAVVFGTDDGVSVTYATRVELMSAPHVWCATSGRASKTVFGDIAGVDSANVVFVRFGGGAADSDRGSVSGSFALRGVGDGPRDLIAWRSDSPGNKDKVIIRRDQDVGNNGSLGVLDFEGTEAVPAATGRLTITGLPGGAGNHRMSYFGERECTYGALYDQQDVADRFTMRGVPALLQRPTDFHRVTVQVSGGQMFRSASESFHAMADRVIALPSELPNPRFARIPGSHPRLTASLTLPPEYQQSLRLLIFQPPRGQIDMVASFAWLGGPKVELRMPDLGVTTGWKRAYLPFTEGQKGWYLFASGANREGQTSACVENARSVDAFLGGRF